MKRGVVDPMLGFKNVKMLVREGKVGLEVHEVIRLRLDILFRNRALASYFNNNQYSHKLNIRITKRFINSRYPYQNSRMTLNVARVYCRRLRDLGVPFPCPI